MDKRVAKRAKKESISIGDMVVPVSRLRQISPVLDATTGDVEEVSIIVDHVRAMCDSVVFLTVMAVLLCMESLLPVQQVSNVEEMFRILQYLNVSENVLIAAYRFTSIHLLPTYQQCLVQAMTKTTIKEHFLEFTPVEIMSWCKQNPNLNLSGCPFHTTLFMYARKHLDQINSRVDPCTNLIRYVIEMSHEHVCDTFEKMIPTMMVPLRERGTPGMVIFLDSMEYMLRGLPKCILSVLNGVYTSEI